MNGFEIKGWCPSALRPMASGDGLVVRLRPRGGRLSSARASHIAELSSRYGNGLIDLTGRANLQIRGVVAESHEALIEALARLGLVDAAVIATAERLKANAIATLDLRHFGAVAIKGSPRLVPRDR